MGLCNQLGNFIPDMSHLMALLRPLLSTKNAFIWLPQHEEAFSNIKKALCKELFVARYDPDFPTTVMSDASRLHGIGGILLQTTPEGKKVIISCASRSLTPAERNYATIELEALALVYALKKFSYWLRGHPGFLFEVDHKPLLGVFNKPLSQIDNKRLFKTRIAAIPYTFDLIFTPGKRHIVADALSRSPYFAAPESSNDFNEHSLIADNPHFCRWTTQNPSFRRLVDIAREDVEYQRIVDCIKNGINVRTLGKDHPAKCLQAVWDRLTLQEVAENPLIILDHSRIYVPIAGRIHLLYNLHEGHPGQTKMQLFTAKFYYWPKLSKDVIN